jgi:antitoxin component HigA of HigAB toxin-antitoxin module
MVMEDRTARVSALLHEAAETHHTVYRITDGVDPDWATWYSEWLLNLSELPDLLGSKPVRSALTAVLVRLDEEYAAQNQGERWEDYYARRLVERLGAA